MLSERPALDVCRRGPQRGGERDRTDVSRFAGLRRYREREWERGGGERWEATTKLSMPPQGQRGVKPLLGDCSYVFIPDSVLLQSPPCFPTYLSLISCLVLPPFLLLTWPTRPRLLAAAAAAASCLRVSAASAARAAGECFQRNPEQNPTERATATTTMATIATVLMPCNGPAPPPPSELGGAGGEGSTRKSCGPH